jgi:hypothetical protein
MGNLFKSLSSFIDGRTASAADTGAALPAAQAEVEVEPDPMPMNPAHEPPAPSGRDTEARERLPAAVRPARALHAIARTTNAVVVTPHTMPLMPTQPQHGHGPGGVELTETEQVRLRIMQAQIKLTSLALYEGPINGMLNLDTVAGLRHFQTLKGLRDTGQLTAATMRALMGPGRR